MRNSTGNCGKSVSIDAADRAPHEQHGVSSKFEENKEFCVKLFCVFFSQSGLFYVTGGAVGFVFHRSVARLRGSFLATCVQY